MARVSWSEGQNRTSPEEPADKRLRKLEQINGILGLLSKDEDLHDDLKLDAVQVALRHWTGVCRLPVQDATKLQSHRRVMYVYERLARLQHVCREIGMPTPLDHFSRRKAVLDLPLALKYFGTDISTHAAFPKQQYPCTDTKVAAFSEARTENRKNEAANQSDHLGVQHTNESIAIAEPQTVSSSHLPLAWAWIAVIVLLLAWLLKIAPLRTFSQSDPLPEP